MSARASTEFLICITGIWRDLMKEYVFKKWLDLADVPEIWSSLQSPRGNSVGPTLRLDHSVSRRHAKVLVIRGTVSSGSSQLFGSTEAGNCYAGW